MKKNILIIVFLAVCLFVAFATTKAQSDTTTYKHLCGNNNIVPKNYNPRAKALIADESWLTYTKTGAKIVTTLESVFQDISLKWGAEFTKITITYKHANGQQFKEYVILVSEATANNIQQWAKKNL